MKYFHYFKNYFKFFHSFQNKAQLLAMIFRTLQVLASGYLLKLISCFPLFTVYQSPWSLKLVPLTCSLLYYPVLFFHSSFQNLQLFYTLSVFHIRMFYSIRYSVSSILLKIITNSVISTVPGIYLQFHKYLLNENTYFFLQEFLHVISVLICF